MSPKRPAPLHKHSIIEFLMGGKKCPQSFLHRCMGTSSYTVCLWPYLAGELSDLLDYFLVVLLSEQHAKLPAGTASHIFWWPSCRFLLPDSVQRKEECCSLWAPCKAACIPSQTQILTQTDTDTNTGTYTGTDIGTASCSLFRKTTEWTCLTVLTKPFLLPIPACFIEWHHVSITRICKQGR